MQTFRWTLLFLVVSGATLSAQIATENHPHGKIRIACSDCHTTKSWKPLRLELRFRHESTGFALEGQHAVVDCAECHASLKFTDTPNDCKSCHDDVHDGTLGQNCLRCHSVQSWLEVSKVTLIHQSSRLPLIGRHQHTSCSNCHAVKNESQFVNLPLNCAGCHLDEYESTNNPSHAQAGFSMRCEICHGDVIIAWANPRFEHTASFPLTFGHARAVCADCHASTFRGTSTACVACHQQDYAATRNPNHAIVGYSTDCRGCHTTQNWHGQAVDHSFFPLVGAHAAIGCEGCHGSGVFRGTPRDCFSCHQPDFNATTNPNHVTGAFSHECKQCHTEVAWKPASFDHHRTRFALTGAHQAVACNQCHPNDRYTGTPMDCFSCHQSDFQTAANPNHVAGNFSHSCETCHTTSVWKPATFDHNQTAFPLQGAHTTVTCQQCHVNNRYAATPKDCYSCHQDDFQRPLDPNHVALNFSHDCLACHTINAWTPATFDHDGQYFRIYSGKHRGKWQSCSTCHVDSQNYRAFECINCHEHDQTKMDDKHKGRKDYQYNSQACYNCHPRV